MDKEKMAEFINTLREALLLLEEALHMDEEDGEEIGVSEEEFERLLEGGESEHSY